MKRREFITLLGGTAATWPLAARAQQPMPVVGYLGSGTFNKSDGFGANSNVEAFRSGLRELGFIEGQNVAIEYRFAENRSERVPEFVADLVRRRVAIIWVGADAHNAASGRVSCRIRQS